MTVQHPTTLATRGETPSGTVPATTPKLRPAAVVPTAVKAVNSRAPIIELSFLGHAFRVPQWLRSARES